MKTVVTLPDGSELSSGRPGAIAIESVTLTHHINEDYSLTPGTVSAEALELTILTQGQTLPVEAGDALTVFQEEEGVSRQVGVYLAEKPTFQSANRVRVTAYDTVSLLDKDLTDWLASLTGWPYPLGEFAQMVCAVCGLELAIEHCVNQSFPVGKFTATAVTGRHLMRWICQAGGAFCRADSQSRVHMDWYASRGVTLSPGGDSFYYQGSLSHADFAVEPVSRVCLRQTGKDVGISYPETAQPDNPWVITANPLLASDDTQALQSVARNLYEQMRSWVYTPCKVTVPAALGLQAGDTFTVTDQKGVTVTGLVMSRVRKGHKDTVQCSGSLRRTDSVAKNSLSHHALSGKVLNLQTSVDGLRAENKDSAGKMAALELTVNGISTEVSRQSQRADYLEQDFSRLDQSASEIKLSVQSLQESEELTHEQVAQLTLQNDSIRAEVSRQSQRADGLEQDVAILDQYATSIEMSVRSLKEQGNATEQQVAQLAVQDGNIRAEVSRQDKSLQEMHRDLTAVEQTARQVKIAVRSVEEQGVSRVQTETGYTFGADGLRIQKAGQEMKNLLDERGMTVSRGDTVMLKADSGGVLATDVTVRNYLIVGTHARLEDHGDGRTACFFL